MAAVCPRFARGVVCAAFVACVATTGLLTGCATPSRDVRADASQTATLATRAILRTDFALAGRFSAKTERDNASGQFRYAQNAAQRTMSLFSPLGTPLGDLVATRDSVTLTLANGEVRTARSLSDLLRTVIDVPLDDAALSAWLQGQAQGAPAATGVERDAGGQLTRFVQGGWEILISSRQEGAAADLPRRMRWSLVAQPDVEVRWVIDEWTLP